MATHARANAYDPVVSPHKFVTGEPGWRPADVSAVENLLQLLGRAIRQFHTYPAASPLCGEAIAACAKALASLDGRDQIVLRVTLHDLLVDDFALGGGTIIEHELVRRLHRAGVAALTVDRAATIRDLSRFCGDLIALQNTRATGVTLAERLLEHGVDKLVVRMAYRPEVVDIGAPRAPLCDLVERERSRRALVPATGPAAFLYPPDKGWIRLDPTSSFNTISLVDLAVLVNDPAQFAGVLLRLTDGEPPGSSGQQTALELKFSDVATLFASLDPRLAQIMFAKLARAVLDLDPAQRQSLLQRTILPGVLDGRADGRVLAEFPDVDLAESLCLLLDLETAAPEVLSAALDRMNVTADRRHALAPLLAAGIRQREGSGRLPHGRNGGAAERYAPKLLQVDGAAPASFREFAAFDLSMNEQTREAIALVRSDVETADPLVVRMQCLSHLVRLEPNPAAVEGFLREVTSLLGDFARASRWHELASWLACHREIAETLREPRPDVYAAITAALNRFCTRDRVVTLVGLYEEAGDRRALANSLVGAFGIAIAPLCIALLDDPAFQGKARSLVQLMCEHARALAPVLVDEIGRTQSAATVAIVRVLGFAGVGYETSIAGVFERGNEPMVREALRALARIGSAQAAKLVAAQVCHRSAWVCSAAQEALCRFPSALTQVHLRDLLGRRDFVNRRPEIAGRLLDRAVQSDPAGLKDTLAALAPLRFHFWRPAVARIGTRARVLSRQ